jgi:hypothetical protein
MPRCPFNAMSAALTQGCAGVAPERAPLEYFCKTIGRSATSRYVFAFYEALPSTFSFERLCLNNAE